MYHWPYFPTLSTVQNWSEEKLKEYKIEND